MKSKTNLKLKKIRQYSFKSREFDIIWRNKAFKEKSFGECSDPNWHGKKHIKIDPRALQDGEILLNILIHEITHAHFFDLDETAVNNFGDELSKFLTQVGFHCDVREKKIK